MGSDLLYSLGMSLLPFPSDSADYEEYCSVMEAMADEAEASAPDPEPVHSDARYTDAELYPESQYGGDGPWNADEESDELRAREDADYYASMHECENEPEDRYLDSQWEDANEYGMEGCCGDF
jgi:hypothetical protein